MFSDENPLLSVCWQFAHFETAKAQPLHKHRNFGPKEEAHPPEAFS